MHPMFYISLLEPIRNPENENDEVDDEEYKVKKILKRKSEKGQIYYLVKWKRYGSEYNLWEPIRYLNCPEQIQAFYERENWRG